MSKLREDLSIGLLGAAAGLFSCSITLLIARIDAYYTYLSRIQEDTYREYSGVEGLWWVPISVWHIILSVVASLLVHRYTTIRPRSPFLLWQVIGIASLYGWALSFLLAVSVDCIMSGNLSSLERSVRPAEVAFIGKYGATVFACNVFYGSVMNASSRQYVEKFDSEVAG